ncbi:hypothetical protein PVAG01_06472 [Phlyctema vagabunda]|uniref:Zinc finger PHD-type domain-containing protein n=1 Tax=Phlyctema vagabunda TaxID=108571 RepID=A0ABR4PH33_9HELO
MSQNRTIKDFFAKAPSRAASKSNSATTSDRAGSATEDARRPRRTSRTMASEKSTRKLRDNTQRSRLTSPEPPATSSKHYSSSSTLSSLPSSSLFVQDDRDIVPATAVKPPSSDRSRTPDTPVSSTSSHTEPETLPETTAKVVLVSKPIKEEVTEIKGSDDEDDEDGSDSDSLPDFSLPFVRAAPTKPKDPTARPVSPPRGNRNKKLARSQHSPLTVQPKYLFSLAELAKESKKDDAAEASSRRLQQLLEASRDTPKNYDGDVSMAESDDDVAQTLKNGEVLDLLVGEMDEEEVDRRREVLKRTQAIVTENRWYFFETKRRNSTTSNGDGEKGVDDDWIFDCVCGDRGKIDDGTHSIACDTCNRWQHSKCVGVTRAAAGRAHFKFVCKACLGETAAGGRANSEPGSDFPVSHVSGPWNESLLDPATRKETFVSGFAENMVSLGRGLPDEILLWLLDELCYESDELLREAYSEILQNCPRQIFQLVKAEKVQGLFQQLGGTEISTSLSEKLKPVKEIIDPYPNQNWGNLISLLRFFSRAADNLSPETVQYLIEMLLRMSADTMVMGNVDLLCVVQRTISNLCDTLEEERWQKSCPEICSSTYASIEQAILRFQATKSIPSTSARTRDLKRRLAAACFFDDVALCQSPTQLSNDINRYTNHLNQAPAFRAISKDTDFHDISARIALLDIAVDDGQYTGLDLSTRAAVALHNDDIEGLGRRIKAIWQAVPQDISASLDRKLEAKIAMEVVTYRILYSLPVNKPKKEVFRLKGGENLQKEKKGMALFLERRRLPGAVSI